MFAPGMNASHVMDSQELDPAVRNDCDYSAKSFALKYLWMVDAMDGRGIAPSTDMSPFFTPAAPRFGQYQCHLRSKHRDAMNDIDDSHDTVPKDCPPDLGSLGDACALHQFPHDWDEDDWLCAIWGRLIPGCSTHDNLVRQYSEGAGVWYDDYDLRDPETLPDAGGGASAVKLVIARRAFDNRDDGAPRARLDEKVAYGGANQLQPMRKMRTDAARVRNNTGWDINLDGFQHIGLLPDFLQDVRNVGVSWENMTPMFNAAEDYVRMWERQCHLAGEHARLSTQIDPLAGCDQAFTWFDPRPQDTE